MLCSKQSLQTSVFITFREEGSIDKGMHAHYAVDFSFLANKNSIKQKVSRHFSAQPTDLFLRNKEV